MVAPSPANNAQPTPPAGHLATSTSSAQPSQPSRATRIWRAIKGATGYSQKQPEWAPSLLDLSEHMSLDVDGSNDEEMTWLSGEDTEGRLTLILVERDSLPTPATGQPVQRVHNLDFGEELSTFHLPDRLVEPGYLDNFRLKGYGTDSPADLESNVPSGRPLSRWFRNSLLPAVRRYFLRYNFPEFRDAAVERSYSERTYRNQKFLAFICSLFLCINWVLAIRLLTRRTTSDTAFYFGVAPVLTLPLPIVILKDAQRRLPRLYQLYLTCSIWSWSIYVITYMRLCGYYRPPERNTCGERDVINLFYYMIALPVVALFGMGQQRLPATIAPLGVIITATTLFVPYRRAWARYAVEHIALQGLILYIHWRREILERNLYYFNRRVRDALVRLNIARANQTRIEAARARSTGYIFHEVRQPLGAAYLAFQNLVASNVVKPEHRIEWETLQTKLTVMSKLLNDVLDQKRMDAGKFEIVERPYSFNAVMRQIITASQITAEQRQQHVIVDLDRNIDIAAGKMKLDSGKQGNTAVQDGILIGDETRLTQIVTNLINNSHKFTKEGGTIRISTKLVLAPIATPRSSLSSSNFTNQKGSGRPSLTAGSGWWPPVEPSAEPATVMRVMSEVDAHWLGEKERLVMRIEISDTGCGISPLDVKERRLFSPYSQAGVGRTQGGAGTGLGLSLVRNMIKLMGGRMGVDSTPGLGTTFWVELAFKVAPDMLPTPDSLLEPEFRPSLGSPLGSTHISPFDIQNDKDSLWRPRSAESIVTANGRPLSVLIVDDDSASRKLMARLISRLGCQTESAEDGQIALDMLGLHRGNEGSSTEPPFNVVLLDNQMPVLSGTEVVAQLRNAGRRDFIVAMTGDMPEEVEAFRHAGADDVLNKPVSESKIRAVLAEAVRRTEHRLQRNPP